MKVLLVTRGNRLLEKALRAAPNVELTVAADLTDDGAAYDFVVLDDVMPDRLARGQRAGDSRVQHELV